jgi:hypothetical protein
MSTVREHATPVFVFPEEDPQIVAERKKRVSECLARLDRTPIRRDVDENGQLLPISDEEWAKRRAKLLELFREWAEGPGDEFPDAHEEALRAIDEERRLSGMRTLFDRYLEQ